MRNFWMAPLFVVCFAAALSADDPSITVTGHGKGGAAPDMATVHTGVTTQAETAAEAVSKNNDAMKSLLGVLRQQGIAPRDVQTSSFQLHPVYSQPDRQTGEPREPRITGYRVTNQVRVKVRDLDRLGTILDAVVKAGSNEISGVSFGLDNDDQLSDTVRRRAIEDAFRRAESYADAANLTLGDVLMIREQGVQSPQPMMMGRAMMMESDSSVPTASGEIELSATVFIEFQLKKQE